MTDCCENRVSLEYKKEVYGQNEKYYEARMETFTSGIEAIRSYRNVDVTPLDIFVPVAYFAIDYESETTSSFIQAKYYLLSKERGDAKVFYCTAYPGTELYKIYQEQILLIKGSGGKLAYRNS